MFLRVVVVVITHCLYAVQDRDTLVRDLLFKGRIDQGTHRPRTFVREHMGRGHIVMASWGREGGKGGKGGGVFVKNNRPYDWMPALISAANLAKLFDVFWQGVSSCVHTGGLTSRVCVCGGV